MKKLLSYLVSLALILTLAAPAQTAHGAVVKLNKTKLSLSIGASYSLKLQNTTGTVKWTSSNKAVASITSKGKVKAVSVGKATITAAWKNQKYKCTVTVKDKTVKIIISALILDGTSIEEYAEQFQQDNPQYLSVKPYDDEHVAVSMYESERIKLLEETNASFNDYLDGILNTEGFEIFTDIKADKLFQNVKIYTDKNKYSNSFAGLEMVYTIAAISDTIQAINLIDIDDRKSNIQILDKKTGKILYPAN